MSPRIEYEHLDSCILCAGKKIRPYKKDVYLYTCSDCGHVFDNPRPSLAAIADYYSEKGKYTAWIKNEKTLSQQWINLVKRIRRFRKQGDLLDVGAGIGFFLSFAKRYFSVAGTEISAEGVQIAREKYGIDVARGEIENIDFNGRKFDIITMHQVLEHVQNPHKTIDTCKSLLKDNGFLYISVPNEARYSLRMLFPAILKLLGRAKYACFSYSGFRKICFETMEEIHLSHFNEPTLRKQLEKQGLKVLESNIDFIDPLMHSSTPVQVVRYGVFFCATVLRWLFRINTYNCFWIMAQKT